MDEEILLTFLSDPKDSDRPEEDVELETLSPFSNDFFDPLSLSLEVSETLPTPLHIAQPEAVAALPQQTPPIEKIYFPWLTLTILVVYVGVFVSTMYDNNYPKHTYPPKMCFPVVFGRFTV
jgi:hypothetical protein